MQILVNGKRAVLKKDSSFDYVSENRFFTGSDSYTLNITFPLKGCPENLEIFGQIQRKEVAKNQSAYSCEIIDKKFSASGILTITEITDIEVKMQFLEGLSQDNYMQTLEDTYINELTLGYPSSTSTDDNETYDVLDSIDNSADWVALPWVNNSSGNIQNKMSYDSEADEYEWEDCTNLSFQPYLLYIAKTICEQINYTYDFSAWEESDYRHLIICSILPAAWAGGVVGFGQTQTSSSDFSKVLPHWSVVEFFEQLGNFLNGSFELNHKTHKVTFAFNSNVLTAAGTVILEDIVDDYSLEITNDDEDEEEYIELCNVKYVAQNYDEWNLRDCNWFIEDMQANATTYANVAAMLSAMSVYKKLSASRIDHYTNSYRFMYCTAEDTYFIFKMIYMTMKNYVNGIQTYYYHYMLTPVNQFGEKVVTEDNTKVIELSIVPARIDFTDVTHGECIFVDVPNYQDDSSLDESSISGTNMSEAFAEAQQSRYYKQIIDGEEEKTTEYYNNIQVAFWDGTNYNVGYLPRPVVDKVTTTSNWTQIHTDYTMRLVNGNHERVGYSIEGKQKYNIKFLSDTIPNVRALFYIKGQKYICKKLTATFKDKVGLSRQIKGEFFKVID